MTWRRQPKLPHARRSTSSILPVHAGALRSCRNRGEVARALGTRRSLPGRRRCPGREVVLADHVSLSLRRAAHRALVRLRRARRLSPASSACAATTCSSRWASTPSDCRPRTPPSATTSIPPIWTFENIAAMRQQYRQMGAMIDWTREVVTCTPEYYHWNQWLFLQMLERGLAYRAKGAVWWCPNDQTVLANEQVLEGNICERCGAEVFKRDLEQWFFRITDYAEELLRRRDARLARARQDDAAQLDRPLRGRAPALRAGDRRRARGLHHPARHGLGRDLHGAGAGASAGGQDHHRRPPGGGRGLHRAGAAADRDRADVDRRGASRDRRLHRRLRDQPGQRRADPDLDRRLCADGLRHRRDHGRAVGDQRDFEFARAFDLPIRVIVQPEDEPESGSGDDDRGLRRSRHAGQFRADDRQAGAGRVAGDHRLAGRDRARQGGGELPPARLADLPPALLGHADPDRSTATTAAWSRCRRTSCRSSCRWTPSSPRPGNRRW